MPQSTVHGGMAKASFCLVPSLRPRMGQGTLWFLSISVGRFLQILKPVLTSRAYHLGLEGSGPTNNQMKSRHFV